MARSYLKMVDDAGDQALSALKQAEDAVVGAVQQASDFVAEILPDLPRNPLAESVPTPREATTTGFNIAEKFLAASKEYTLDLLKALEPVTGKVFWNAKKTSKKASASTKAA
jgi:hypothetical protein